MEMLQRDGDVLAPRSDRKVFDGFLDIVGRDVDNSYGRNIIHDVVYDSTHISQGGQIVRPGAGITVNIFETDSLHYLWKYGIVADLYCYDSTKTDVNSIIENAAILFEGISLKIGGVEWGFTSQAFYAQQKLTKMDKKRLNYIQRGLALKTDNWAFIPAKDIKNLGSDGGGGGLSLANTSVYQSLYRQLKQHVSILEDVVTGGKRRLKIYVAIPCIFPCLWELPHDGCVFTSFDQKVTMSIKTNQADQCLVSAGENKDLNYFLENIGLSRCYSKLDSLRCDEILKSQVILPKLKYEVYPISTCTQTMNLNFPVSKNERLKQLIFALHTNIPASKVEDPDVVCIEDNLINDTKMPLKYPLGYFPQVFIEQLKMNIAGEPQTIDLSQNQFIHLTPYFGDQEETYTFPLQHQLKKCFALDLTRFGFDEDYFGSSGKAVTLVNFTIKIKTDSDAKSLYNQGNSWSSIALNNFQLYAFLETQTLFECKNGLYHDI